jgi:ribosome-associated translation inhibitor RaiA
MQIRVLGANIEVGQSLTQYVEENLAKVVKK